MSEIPLRVLIVDFSPSAKLLCDSLSALPDNVLSVTAVGSLAEANAALSEQEINSIFIDPMDFGLDAAGEFVFQTRKQYPAIVIVLFVEFNAMERSRREFFAGERGRFAHYFKLDKGTPAAIFRDEVRAVVSACEDDLRHTLTSESIQVLQSELARLKASKLPATADTVAVPAMLLKEISEQLRSLASKKQMPERPVIEKSVFLSHRFAEAEYVDGLRSLLEREGLSVVTGQEANTHIGQAILDRIRASEFFLCVMTRADEKSNGRFTTSPWLLEEKGAALAFGKRIVLMVEEGVDDVGGLQGDWQRIHFSPKGFTKAAIRAVDQLKSYAKTD